MSEKERLAVMRQVSIESLNGVDVWDYVFEKCVVRKVNCPMCYDKSHNSVVINCSLCGDSRRVFVEVKKE